MYELSVQNYLRTLPIDPVRNLEEVQNDVVEKIHQKFPEVLLHPKRPQLDSMAHAECRARREKRNRNKSHLIVESEATSNNESLVVGTSGFASDSRPNDNVLIRNPDGVAASPQQVTSAMPSSPLPQALADDFEVAPVVPEAGMSDGWPPLSKNVVSMLGSLAHQPPPDQSDQSLDIVTVPARDIALGPDVEVSLYRATASSTPSQIILHGTRASLVSLDVTSPFFADQDAQSDSTQASPTKKRKSQHGLAVIDRPATARHANITRLRNRDRIAQESMAREHERKYAGMSTEISTLVVHRDALLQVTRDQDSQIRQQAEIIQRIDVENNSNKVKLPAQRQPSDEIVDSPTSSEIIGEEPSDMEVDEGHQTATVEGKLHTHRGSPSPSPAVRGIAMEGPQESAGITSSVTRSPAIAQRMRRAIRAPTTSERHRLVTEDSSSHTEGPGEPDVRPGAAVREHRQGDPQPPSPSGEPRNRTQTNGQGTPLQPTLPGSMQIIVDRVVEISRTVKRLEEQVAILQDTQARSTSTPRRGGRRGRPSTGKFLVTKPQLKRGVDRNTLLRNVREVMNEMIGIKQDKDIIDFDMSQFPSISDVQHYMRRGIQAKDIAGLGSVCWDNLDCPWNQSVSENFVRLFLAQHPEHEGRDEEIENHFWQRLETLRYLHRRCAKKDGESLDQCEKRRYQILWDEQARLRKRTRREQTFNDRHQITSLYAESHPDEQLKFEWGRALDLVERLGVNGMSSDDSEGDDLNRRYVIKSRAWRSTKVQEVLLRIDQEIPSTKKSLYGNAPPGNRPRIRGRARHAAQSTRMAVALLPVNFYRRTWLENLSEAERAQLAPKQSLPLPAF
ncbi:hypothetical protein V5O48_014909 [Marasmius crinis-equi]|uniref:Uncharacterized protein n=1 Tax=Marasmius crinis-equi TaxID=585013 RepID=A0ABR3EVY8_9AGAR